LSAFAAKKARSNLAENDVPTNGAYPPSNGYPVKDGLDYDSEDGMQSDSDIVLESETVDLEFGSWIPRSKNLSDTSGETKIRFLHGDTISIVGECHITVKSGIIAVNGAILISSLEPHRIIAPSTEPVPLIRCVSSEGAAIVVTSISEHSSLQSLKRLSPLFSGIWGNETHSKSFKIVCNSSRIWSELTPVDEQCFEV
jgi:hypothetical protein